MAKLKLYFTSEDSPQLFRITFAHYLLSESKTVVRGKNINSASHYGNFQWSEAVKGLALLSLATACKQSAELSGLKGSLAASLDYAISKPPQWIQDIFGYDKQGNLIAKRIFMRINSERKLQGPTTISVNPAQLSESDIEVYLEDKKLIKPEIEFLKEKLEISLGGAVEPTSHEKSFKDLLFPIFKQECYSRLLENFNFSRYELQKKLKNLSFNRSAKKASSTLDFVLDQLAQNTDSNTRLGVDACNLIKQELENEPFEFACTAVQGSVVALLSYLKNNDLKLMQVNSRFAYATSLVNRIIAQDYEPDFVSAGVGPALKLLSARADTYQGFMLAPDLSHRIITTETNEKVSAGEYLITAEEPNTSTFCFDSLSQQGVINDRKVQVIHLEPDEIFSAFKNKESNLKSLLWFPHYQLQQQVNGAKLAGPSELSEYNQWIMILVHKRFACKIKKMQAMRLALANAWLKLREPGQLDLTLRNVLSDQTYLSDLRRFTGCYYSNSQK